MIDFFKLPLKLGDSIFLPNFNEELLFFIRRKSSLNFLMSSTNLIPLPQLSCVGLNIQTPSLGPLTNCCSSSVSSSLVISKR